MTLIHLSRAFFSLLLMAGLSWQAVTAASLLPVPVLTARFMDLSDPSIADGDTIESRLTHIERQSGAQIVVFIVPSTGPESIEAYAHRVASSWKIGRPKEGDGVLLLIAKNDRNIRIEVARALEGNIPDITASHIIDAYIAPHFQQNNYTAGILAALDALESRIQSNHRANDSTAIKPDVAKESMWGPHQPDDVSSSHTTIMHAALPVIPNNMSEWMALLKAYGFYLFIITSFFWHLWYADQKGNLITSVLLGTGLFIRTTDLPLTLILMLVSWAITFGLCSYYKAVRADTFIWRIFYFLLSPIALPILGAASHAIHSGSHRSERKDTPDSPSSGSSSSSGGGGFSSGGGGSFGGGGASGKW